MKRLAVVVVVVGLSAARVLAQEDAVRGPGRDELVKLVDAYLLSNLQENLSLSDEQFVKILPLVKRWQADRRAFQQRRMTTLGEMRRLFETGAATEPRLGEILRGLKQAELDEQAASHKNVEALDAQLSLVQQAKLRIFEVRVQQRLREIIERQRQQGGIGARQRKPPGEQP